MFIVQYESPLCQNLDERVLRLPHKNPYFLRDYSTRSDEIFSKMQIMYYSFIILKYIQINSQCWKLLTLKSGGGEGGGGSGLLLLFYFFFGGEGQVVDEILHGGVHSLGCLGWGHAGDGDYHDRQARAYGEETNTKKKNIYIQDKN